MTRDDVARYARVSTAVVSYVVNGGPKPVAPETAARVREAIEVLGYRPNLNARALSTGRTRTLGVVAPDTTNPFFAELLEQIQLRAHDAGYSLITANSLRERDLERRNLAELAARQVDGIIAASMLHAAELATLLPAGPRLVRIGNSDAGPTIFTVGTDLAAGMRLAVQHLLEHGHPSVALLAGGTSASSRAEDVRVAAWREVLHERGLPPGRLIPSDFTRQGAREAVLGALADAPAPPALIATSDIEAIGAMRGLREVGLRIPEDIAVMGFDDVAESSFTCPPLSTVRQPLERIAASALEAVVALADDNRTVLLTPTLAIRDSCGAHPGAGAGPRLAQPAE